MRNSDNPETRAGRVVTIFQKMRADGKTDQEIFAQASGGLKQLARKMLRNEPPGASMHATRLLDEVYIKLFDSPASNFRWETGQQFFLAVARAMHDLKVDYIRRKMSGRRGAGRLTSLEQLREEGYDPATSPESPRNKNAFESQSIEAFELKEALRRLREEYPDREKAIMLVYYGGLSRTEAAGILRVSPEKVKTDLLKGRARMRFYLTE